MPAEVTRSEPLPKIPHVDAYKRLMGRKGSRITLLQRISKTTMVVNSTDVAVRGQSTAVEAGIQLLRETFDDWKKGDSSSDSHPHLTRFVLEEHDFEYAFVEKQPVIKTKNTLDRGRSDATLHHLQGVKGAVQPTTSGCAPDLNTAHQVRSQFCCADGKDAVLNEIIDSIHQSCGAAANVDQLQVTGVLGKHGWCVSPKREKQMSLEALNTLDLAGAGNNIDIKTAWDDALSLKSRIKMRSVFMKELDFKLESNFDQAEVRVDDLISDTGSILMFTHSGDEAVEPGITAAPTKLVNAHFLRDLPFQDVRLSVRATRRMEDVALKEVRDIAKTTEVTQEGFVIVRCEQEARKQMSSHRILLNTVYTGSYNQQKFCVTMIEEGASSLHRVQITMPMLDQAISSLHAGGEICSQIREEIHTCLQSLLNFCKWLAEKAVVEETGTRYSPPAATPVGSDSKSQNSRRYRQSEGTQSDGGRADQATSWVCQSKETQSVLTADSQEPPMSAARTQPSGQPGAAYRPPSLRSPAVDTPQLSRPRAPSTGNAEHDRQSPAGQGHQGKRMPPNQAADGQGGKRPKA